MADYYPLLAKAVSGLDPNTLEARQSIYARARAALTRQLEAIEPAVPGAVVERELAALDAVVARIEQEHGGAAPTEPLPPDPVAEIATPIRQPARPQVIRRENPRARNPLVVVGFALGFVVVMAVATLAYLRRNEPAAVPSRPIAQTPAPAPQQTVAKTEDRVQSSSDDAPTRPAQPPPAPTPAPSQPQAPRQPDSPAPVTTAPPVQTSRPVAVANRMMLVLEGKVEPQKVDVRQGTVVWRTETVNGGQGQSLEVAIRGTIDVAEARVRAEITIQRNRDAAFPASHTIQVQFSTLGQAEIGPIQSLSQIELRQTESQPGYPLAGQGITVMENVFLVALAQIDPALARNIDMMKTRPLLYLEFQAAGGRRGAMIIEKGVSGQQVFDEAFRAWQQ